ncbi:ankyrin repeat and SAM domain-containing protein 6-like [Aphidius gifuensis]|nr:ankyrin repeat and SAM domain-containing protein 6-like [Aphidius gifuensis]XP_044006137.1 ankyrin repeat and SAM domain-containing protein 6-like [Aphidius gifuensis]XP_044006138.1 ankyrin repeat and SAM domain-containing protein 6-like [Aphidius gifuensis]
MADLNNHDDDDDDDPEPTTSTPEDKIKSVISFSQKYKLHRPPNLVINDDNNLIPTIENLSQCSPVRSPFPSNESLNDDFLINKNDTTKIVNESCNNSYNYSVENNNVNLTMCQMKILCLLKHFGLSHLAFIFIEQEIDIELFVTLVDQDLQEIGIEKKTDRQIILSVIAECKKRFK